MKISISYFYKIRFFKPWMIPISTAMFDPKWYHNFKDNHHKFKDKNKVINGFRYQSMVPDSALKGLCSGSNKCKDRDPVNCKFLKGYSEQLDNLDFDKVFKDFSALSNKYEKELNHEIELVLIVYETPNNPCSERTSIINLFKKNGIEVNEFDI